MTAATEKRLQAIRTAIGKLIESVDTLEAELSGEPTVYQVGKELLADFRRLWLSRYSENYVLVWGKHMAIMRRLLKALPPDEIKMRMRRYVASSDPFLERARHSIELFGSKVNEFGSSEGEDDFELSPAVACDHVPKCRTDAEHTRVTAKQARGDVPF